MATRSRLNWAPDSRGYYTRQIGWERSKSGKLQQHKFLLGTDRKQAEIRERKLRELWDQFEKSCGEPRPLWPVALLEIAARIAKGIPDIPVPRAPREMQHQYAARLQRMQAKYPVICFIPEDQHAYEIGQAALELFEAVPIAVPDFKVELLTDDQVLAREQIQQLAREAGIAVDPALEIAPALRKDSRSPIHDLGILKPGDPAAVRSPGNAQPLSMKTTPKTGVSTPSIPAAKSPSATLHHAFKRYQAYLNKEFFRQETGHISPWGRIQVRQIKNLQRHHADMLLSKLDATAVGELIGYWRRRPCKLGSTAPISAKAASHYLGTLIRFLTWLHSTSEFEWTKPHAFNDFDRRIRRLPSDHVKRSLEQVDTFSLDELRLLMRYGQPLDRLLLLLGLNCGFGRAEIASLLVGEVHLRRGHTPREQEILGFATTNDDSFIKRIRRKSGVYGEHILFPLTVRALEWALERRKTFPDFDQTARLILNEKGTPLDQQTKGSNANQAIPNHFARLIKRIRDDGQTIRMLSFGKLRKTASDLIKRHSDGEIAGVFDCHGEPVKTDSLSDAYTNRPFGKVFRAIRAVETYLGPVFAEAGTSPFSLQPQAYTKRSVIERIIALHEQGFFTGQIAAAVGLSGQTVSRHIRQYQERQSSTATE